MSLEYQVEQLVAVLNRGVQNSAVAEIIRQRDEAITRRDQEIHDREWWKERYRDVSDRREKLERKNAALRGVITRMKRKLDATKEGE